MVCEKGIELINTIPMSDTQGLATTAYTFNVVNNGNMNASYELFLDNEELESGETRLSDSNIKYSITRNSSSENPQLLSSLTNRKIDEAIVNKNSTNTYTLRLWIDSEATTSISGYVFRGKLRLVAQQTEDEADDTYSVSGYLYDNNDNPVNGGVVVAYSEPKYTTTNSEG